MRGEPRRRNGAGSRSASRSSGAEHGRRSYREDEIDQDVVGMVTELDDRSGL
jgi:hypothetical protein